MPLVTNRFVEAEHSKGTAGAKPEEGMGDGRSVCPESSGLHAAYIAKDNGMQLRKEKLIS